MKKFTLVLSIILITVFCFAQQVAHKVSAEFIIQNDKSEWVGNTAFSGLASVDPGYEYAIRFTAGTLTSGEEITKVKFFADIDDTQGYGFDGSSFIIKVYEGGSFDEVNGYDVITACGTAVYTENYTATVGGPQEVTLATPYTIGTGEFWVAIHCNALSILGLGDADETVLNQYVVSSYHEGTETDYWFNNEFCANPPTCDEVVVYPYTLAVYVDDGGTYVENSDLSTYFVDNGTDQNIITELTIGTDADLDIVPVIYNAGPDNADQIITIEFTVDGTSVGSQEFDPVTGTTAGYIGAPGGILFPVSLMAAAEMDTQGLTTFDVCVSLTYAGVDNDLTNNQACITITRGEVAENICDLEAIFMTSNTDPTPIPSTLTITATDDVTVFPGVINNGPDDANTTATVNLTIDGTPIGAPQSVDMTGLVSGALFPLTVAGQPITAANMDAMGLTGTFDVCMTITYDGTDNNVDNNETCVTVTREAPVNVDTNIAAAISVFPNPANSIITVANAENENILVLNMLGEIVANINNANSNQTIDISNLSNGAYFVRVNSEVFKINVLK